MYLYSNLWVFVFMLQRRKFFFYLLLPLCCCKRQLIKYSRHNFNIFFPCLFFTSSRENEWERGKNFFLSYEGSSSSIKMMCLVFSIGAILWQVASQYFINCVTLCNITKKKLSTTSTTTFSTLTTKIVDACLFQGRQERSNC